MSTYPVLSADSLSGNDVRNPAGEDLGKIEDLMINTETGEVAYAVLSFGGFLGMGDKLFALPWRSLQLDTRNHAFVLDVDKERLENAPGFDKDNWPNMADPTWANQINDYYAAR